MNNPPNPYLKYSAEYLGEPPIAKLEIYEENELDAEKRRLYG